MLSVLRYLAALTQSYGQVLTHQTLHSWNRLCGGVCEPLLTPEQSSKHSGLMKLIDQPRHGVVGLKVLRSPKTVVS